MTTEDAQAAEKVALADAERRGLLELAYSYAFPKDDADPRPEWSALEGYVERIMAEAVERERAARLALVAKVEAACVKAEMLTQDVMGVRSQHWRGPDYADGLDAGIETTTALAREAIR